MEVLIETIKTAVTTQRVTVEGNMGENVDETKWPADKFYVYPNTSAHQKYQDACCQHALVATVTHSARGSKVKVQSQNMLELYTYWILQYIQSSF